MSASTVSITANPAARRRPVVVGERKSAAVDLISGEAAAVPLSTSADETAAAAKDLSNSTSRGGGGTLVVDRSRDLLQIRKAPASAATAAAAATASPRHRTRRSAAAAAKPVKPKWQTLLSVLSKNLLLVLLLLGIAQLFRKLTFSSSQPQSPISSSDAVAAPVASQVESRIAEVDAFVKKTAKMLQLQVDLVDRKIDERAALIADEVKRLDAMAKDLDKALQDLSFSEFLTRGDFDKLANELLNAHKGGGEQEDVAPKLSLDDVRALAKQVIDKEIEWHAADGLGMVDYALASGGGMVVKHSEPFFAMKGGGSWFLTKNRNGVHADADRMLKPSFGEPGACFPLNGSSGFVQIRLRTEIIPEAITLEHVAKSVAYDRSSAPKDCRVSGWRHSIDVAVDSGKILHLAHFTYDLEKSSAQTFKVVDTVGSGVVDTIRLDFTSNYGSRTHTCIYRLRVHGHESSSIAVMPTPF